jgi:hypothetical protein
MLYTPSTYRVADVAVANLCAVQPGIQAVGGAGGGTLQANPVGAGKPAGAITGAKVRLHNELQDAAGHRQVGISAVTLRVRLAAGGSGRSLAWARLLATAHAPRGASSA